MPKAKATANSNIEPHGPRPTRTARVMRDSASRTQPTHVPMTASDPTAAVCSVQRLVGAGPPPRATVADPPAVAPTSRAGASRRAATPPRWASIVV